MAEVLKKSRKLVEEVEQKYGAETVDERIEDENLRRHFDSMRPRSKTVALPKRGHDSDIDADRLDGMHADEIIRKGRMAGGGPIDLIADLYESKSVYWHNDWQTLDGWVVARIAGATILDGELTLATTNVLNNYNGVLFDSLASTRWRGNIDWTKAIRKFKTRAGLNCNFNLRAFIGLAGYPDIEAGAGLGFGFWFESDASNDKLYGWTRNTGAVEKIEITKYRNALNQWLNLEVIFNPFMKRIDFYVNDAFEIAITGSNVPQTEDPAFQILECVYIKTLATAVKEIMVGEFDHYTAGFSI